MKYTTSDKIAYILLEKEEILRLLETFEAPDKSLRFLVAPENPNIWVGTSKGITSKNIE